MSCRRCRSFQLNPSERSVAERVWQWVVPLKPVRCGRCGFRQYTPAPAVIGIQLLVVAVAAAWLLRHSGPQGIGMPADVLAQLRETQLQNAPPRHSERSVPAEVALPVAAEPIVAEQITAGPVGAAESAPLSLIAPVVEPSASGRPAAVSPPMQDTSLRLTTQIDAASTTVTAAD